MKKSGFLVLVVFTLCSCARKVNPDTINGLAVIYEFVIDYVTANGEKCFNNHILGASSNTINIHYHQEDVQMGIDPWSCDILMRSMYLRMTIAGEVTFEEELKRYASESQWSVDIVVPQNLTGNTREILLEIGSPENYMNGPIRYTELLSMTQLFQ